MNGIEMKCTLYSNGVARNSQQYLELFHSLLLLVIVQYKHNANETYSLAINREKKKELNPKSSLSRQSIVHLH